MDEVQLTVQMTETERSYAAMQANESNKKHKTGDPGEKNGLGKDSFLKLLVTELRHQDPTKPMEDKEFIAQMAQFSSLEQMSNINKEMRNLVQSSKSAEAYSILGRDIEAYDPKQQKAITGTVNSVFYKGDEIMIVVGDDHVSMADVHSVNVREQSN
ncbi:MAG: flagellar hook assembly protein FlgD [Leptospirales bacterium]|nr:flagellar hook assembly protein FlgD [Leptospirales bacterium]